MDATLEAALAVFGGREADVRCGQYTCGNLLELAAVACQRGRGDGGRTLARYYVERYRRTELVVWRRAEVARWRGDNKVVEAWHKQVFPSAESVDGPRDDLLRAFEI